MYKDKVVIKFSLYGVQKIIDLPEGNEGGRLPEIHVGQIRQTDKQTHIEYDRDMSQNTDLALAT